MGLVALLLYAAYHAARIGLADVYAAPAMTYLQARDDAGAPLTDREWQRLDTALQLALALAPANPDYLAHLGWLQQIKLRQDRDSLASEEVRRYGALASRYYGRAAALRLTWPYDWGNLAIEEYRLQKYASPEYSLSLVRAARFGPWKNDAQLLIAELGSDTLQFLSPEARRAYLLTLDRALRQQPAELVATVSPYRVWDEVCGLIDAASAAESVSYAQNRAASGDGGGNEFHVLGQYCRQPAPD